MAGPPGQSRPAIRAGPAGCNLFGTNQTGVDVFAKMVHGTTVALLVGFVSMGIAATIGITVGALAGYFGGWVDMVISRITEVVMCIPTLVLILALLAIVEKPTIWKMMAVLGLTGWTGISRLMRAEFLRLKSAEFVTAARAVGAGPGADHPPPRAAQRPGPGDGADHLRDRRGDPDRERPLVSRLRPAAPVGQLGLAAQRRPLEPQDVVAGRSSPARPSS